MQETREDSLDIRQILQTLRKHIGLIIVFTLLTTAAGAAYTFFIATPMYSATTQLVVKLSDSEANAQYAGQVQGNLQIMDTLNQVIVSPAILNPVKTKLNLSESISQLQSSITATSSANSQVIVLTAKSPYPSLATDIANTTAEIFTQNVTKELNVQNVSILAPAEPNTNLTPISPKPKTYLAIAAAAGLLIGVLIAFLLELLNTKVRNEQDLEALGLLSLGTVFVFSEDDFKVTSKGNLHDSEGENKQETSLKIPPQAKQVVLEDNKQETRQEESAQQKNTSETLTEESLLDSLSNLESENMAPQVTDSQETVQELPEEKTEKDSQEITETTETLAAPPADSRASTLEAAKKPTRRRKNSKTSSSEATAEETPSSAEENISETEPVKKPTRKRKSSRVSVSESIAESMAENEQSLIDEEPEERLSENMPESTSKDSLENSLETSQSSLKWVESQEADENSSQERLRRSSTQPRLRRSTTRKRGGRR